MLVEGKPACRPKELLVSVPEPNQQDAPTVITLKLDEPLTGKPEPGEIHWVGVPSAFTPDPFMLTMDTEKASLKSVRADYTCVFVDSGQEGAGEEGLADEAMLAPKFWKRAAAAGAAALWLTCAYAQAPAAAQTEKKKQVKDQGEFEIYNQALKDASNPQKELQDLDAWSQKYPESDFKDDRLYMYMQAYAAMQPPQPMKVIDYGQQLMAKDLPAIFPGAAGGRNELTVLFQVAWNVAALPNATPEQLALGDKAAHQLLDFAPKYFIAANKPSSTSEADWDKARDDIEKRAKTALTAMALAPANQALAAKNYAAADAAFTKALGEYPDSAAASYGLGRALVGEAAANPDKAGELNARAIYEFVAPR